MDSTVTLFPVANRQTGHFESPNFPIPAGLDIEFTFWVDIVPTDFVSPSQSIAYMIQQSFDSGVTWVNVSGGVYVGQPGGFHDKQGNLQSSLGGTTCFQSTVDHIGKLIVDIVGPVRAGAHIDFI